jgi:Cdc6-like AAA superfamily ATPase
LYKYKDGVVQAMSVLLLYVLKERPMRNRYPFSIKENDEYYKEMCIRLFALHMYTYKERMNIIDKLNNKEYLFLEVKNRPSYDFYASINILLRSYGNRYIQMLLIGLVIRENKKVFYGEANE